MLRYLLDTDHLTLFEHGHALVIRRMSLQPAGTVGICVVTVEEAFEVVWPLWLVRPMDRRVSIITPS